MTAEGPSGRGDGAGATLRWGLRLAGLVLQVLLTTVLVAWSLIDGPGLFIGVAIGLWLLAIAVLVLAVQRRRRISDRGAPDPRP